METKKSNKFNPFLIFGYTTPDYFCDREEESDRIIDAMENARNITIMSLRRLGKTGLIHHVFNSERLKKQADCFYIDIYPTNDLNDFIKVFSKEIIGNLDKKQDILLKKAATLFKSIRPVFSIDPITGAPQIQINLEDERNPERSLDEIFNYLRQSKRKIIVAFDEFQQISHYPQKNMEALLRTYGQQSNNVNFIYSGSQKHILQNMFTSYSRPFYQSSEFLFLEPISIEAYSPFIIEKMAEGKKQITPDAIRYLYDTVFGHTWYIQYVMNRLYTSPYKIIDESIIKKWMEKLVVENESIYWSYYRLLTNMQWSLLKAISFEGCLREPTSKEFTQKYNFSPSSVKTALKSLIEKEMIYEEGGTYYVYDHFLAFWLQLRY
jgi:AAA+ ATPase superfamily predicted ATPase